jgi:hypothetical protein
LSRGDLPGRRCASCKTPAVACRQSRSSCGARRNRKATTVNNTGSCNGSRASARSLGGHSARPASSLSDENLSGFSIGPTTGGRCRENPVVPSDCCRREADDCMTRMSRCSSRWFCCDPIEVASIRDTGNPPDTEGGGYASESVAACARNEWPDSAGILSRESSPPGEWNKGDGLNVLRNGGSQRGTRYLLTGFPSAPTH